MGKAKEIAELGDKITVSGGTVTVADISTSTFSGTSIHSMQDVDLTGIAHNMFLKYNLSNTRFEVVAGNTSSIDEGTNLYYTDARVASYLSSNDFDTATNIVASITDSAPGTLDTLNELAAALGDDANFSTTVTNSIATKLPLSGGTMTGVISGFESTGIDDNASATAITILSDGNVGIGNTNPQGVLDLGSSSTGRSITWAKYNNIFGSYSEGSLNLTSNYYGDTSSNTYKTSLTANFGAAGIEISGTGGSSTNGVIQFFVDATASKTADAAFVPSERMRIDSSGNVGIGTDNPTNTYGPVLHIRGTNPNLRLDGTGPGSWAWISMNTADAGDSRAMGTASDGTFRITNVRDNLDSGIQFAIKQDGNVGIGTTSPVGTLHLHSADTAVRLTSNQGSNTPLAQLQYSGSGGYFLRMGDSSNNEDVMIRTYGNSHFNGGNVGIGTNNPQAKLHINGSDENIRLDNTGTSNYGLEIWRGGNKGASIAWGEGNANLEIKNYRNDSQADGPYANIDFFTGGTNANASGSPAYSPDLRMRIQQTGEVGIGTTNPTEKLDVRGRAYIENNGVNYARIGTSYSGHYFESQSWDNYDGFEIYQQHGSNTTRNSFVVNDNRTGSKSAAFAVRGDGNVGIGNSDPTDKLTMTVGNGGGILQSTYYSGTATSGQKLGVIGFKGYSQGNTVAGADAKIEAVAAGNHSGSSAPANLDFYTKPESIGPGSAAILRHRIHEEGHQTIYKGTNNWSVQRHSQSSGCFVCHRLYGASSSTTTYNLLRYRRHYWGSGSVKFTLSQTYYSSTSEGEYWLTGHGRSDGSYTPNYSISYVDVYNGPGTRLFTNMPGGAPGNSDAEIVDVSISIPAYYYYMVRVEVSHSEYYTTTSTMGSVNSFALFT